MLDVANEAGLPDTPLDIELPELWSSLYDGGPEAEAIKTECRDQVMAALEESVAALAPRDKTILKLHVVDDLGQEAIRRSACASAPRPASCAAWRGCWRKRSTSPRNGSSRPSTERPSSE